MQNFQRLKSGHKWAVNEQTANAILASAEDFTKHARDANPAGPPEFRFESGLCQVRNATGYDQAQFAVLGIDVPSILPASNLAQFKWQLLVDGILPARLDHGNGRCCVLLEPIAAGRVGWALVDGVCQCQVYVNDATDAYADVMQGSTSALTSCRTGPIRILWKAAGTGMQWAIVRLAQSMPMWNYGTVTTPPSTDGTTAGVAEIYVLNPLTTPPTWVDSGLTQQFWNPPDGTTFGAGDWVDLKYHYQADRWLPASFPKDDVWVQLYERLDAGGTANAYDVNWDPTASSGNGAYAANTGGSTHVVKDLSGIHWGLKGEWVRCHRKTANNGPVWEVISSGAPWHIFTLSGDLAQGSYADATVTIRGTSVTQRLYDKILPAYHTIINGTAVYAFYNVEASQWQVLGKVFIEKTPLTDLRYYSSTHKVQTQGAYLAVLSERTPAPDWADKITPATKFVYEGLQWDGTGKKFQAQKVQAYAFEFDSESWVDAFTPTSQAVVVGWQVSGTNIQIQTQTLYIFGEDAAGAWTTVATGTTC